MPSIRKAIIILWLIVSNESFGAFEIQSSQPAFIARGDIISLHPYSLNPACALSRWGWFWGSSYSRLFGIKGLDCFHFIVGLTSLQGWNYSLSSQYLGTRLYQEKTVGISLAREIGQGIYTGITMNYYGLSISDYEAYHALGISVGSMWRMDPHLGFGILFRNVNAPQLGGRKNCIPQSYTVGLQYLLSPKVEVDLELYKDSLFPFATRAGVAIEFWKYITIMLGGQLNPDRLSGGFTCSWKGLRVSVAVRHHTVLPYTYYLGCSFQW